MAAAKKDEKKTMSAKDKVTLQPLKKETKPKPAPVDVGDDDLDDKPDEELTPIDIEAKEAKEAAKKQKEAEKELETIKNLIATKKFFLPIKGKR